jgi:hypothetical protein
MIVNREGTSNDPIGVTCGYTCPADEDGIIVNSSAVRTRSSRSMICMKDVTIPFTDVENRTVKIAAGSSITLDKFKLAVIKVKDNGVLSYRLYDAILDKWYCVNYDLSLALSTTNIEAEKITVTGTVTATPQNEPVVISWLNVGDLIYMEDDPSWASIQQPWTYFNPGNTTNQLALSSMSAAVEASIYRAQNGTATGTMSVQLDSGHGYGISLTFSIFFPVDPTPSITLVAAMTGFMVSEATYYKVLNMNIEVNEDLEMSIGANLALVSPVTFKYDVLKSVMIVSNSVNEYQITLLNRTTGVVETEIMMAR